MSRTLPRRRQTAPRRGGPLLSVALRALALAAPPIAILAHANTVYAQTPPVTSQVSASEVEVGEAFTVELRVTITNASDRLTEPELRAPAGFSMSGPAISQQTYMQLGGGGASSQLIVGVTWTLVASNTGNFNIPAPGITWNRQKLHGTPATVKVVPQGTHPPKQQGGFLFPGGFPGGVPPGFGPNWPFGSSQPDEDVDQPGEDPALALPRAPNDDIFLHAITDKKTAVVGEQVTVSVYRYSRPGAVSEVRDSSAMPMQDFLRYSLIKDAGVQTTQVARAGGRQFRVRLLEKYALFPLRTGKLATGSVVETYTAANGRRVLKRASEDLAIQVTEPPLANRPVGFRQGDVGNFQISALVQPRRVEEGGSLAVTIKVSGTGNFPTSLKVPEKTGLEWLDPEKKENIEPRAGEITGFRTFGYVVRLTRRGTVDLGTVELPYWNPRNRRYEVAKTALGAVEVTPSAQPAPGPTAAPSPTAPDDPWRDLPPPRATLSPYTAAPEASMWLPGYQFGAAVVAPPFLAIAGIAGVEGLRRARSRMANRKTSHRTLAVSALDEARAKKGAGDERGAAAAVEKAIVLAIEAATGLKARGVLKESLARELVEKGVPDKVAVRASESLAACDKARFDPLAAAEVKLDDAEALVTDLLRVKSP